MSDSPRSVSARMPDLPAQLDTAERFAATLTDLRTRAGLSVRDLARAVGVPASTVGGYCSGRHLPPATRPEVLVGLLEAVGVPTAEHPAWLVALRRLHARRLPRELGVRPFPGLAAFTTEDAEHFFGRERDAEALLEMVLGSPVTVVVGSSGSGKTSLVQAGLVPLLPRTWRVRVVRPGSAPHAEIRAALAEPTPSGPADAPPRDGDRSGAAEPGTPTRAHLVILDQVEQLWTLDTDEASRAELLGLLGRFPQVGTTGPDRRLLLVVRSDFYAALADVDWLRAALRQAQFLVEPLDRQALARTIQGPAHTFGIALEPGLVGQIVGDARRGAGRPAAILPHLSHTLAVMWERAGRRALTCADYEAVGGIAGALAQTAEQAYAALPPDRRDTARQALLRLVVVEAGAAPVAGVVTLGELEEPTRDVLEHFAAYRIVTLDRQQARLSHEAVIGSWQRLGDWIAADRAWLLVAGMISREAAAWQAADGDPALLLRGSRLASAEELPDPARQVLTRTERDYVEASLDTDRAQRARRAAAHRRTRRLLVATSALAAAALVMTIGLVVSRRDLAEERDAAQRQEKFAQSRQLGVLSGVLARTDPVAAAQLAVAAYRLGDSIEARSALFARSAGPRLGHLDGPAGARIARAAPGRALVASGGAGPGLDVVDLSGPAPKLVSHVVTGDASDTCFALAFAPDGQRLAFVNRVGLVGVVDLTDPATPRELPGEARVPTPGPTDLDYAVAFSADGSQLLVGTGGHGILRFAAPPGSAPTPLPGMPSVGAASGPVFSLATLPDGRVLAGGAEGSLALWAPGAPAPTATVTLSAGPVVALAGHGREVYAGQRGSNRAHRVALGDNGFGEVVTLAQFDSWVNAVAVSADGEAVAFGSSDHTVRTFSRDGRGTGSQRLVENIASLAYVEGRLVVGLTDGQLVVRREVAPAADDLTTTGYFVAWSGDGTRLASFVYSRKSPQVRLWDAADPLALRLLATIRPTDADVPSGTGDISADGRLVAAGTLGGRVLVWDVTVPSAPVAVLDTKVGSQTIQQVTFLDENTLLVAGDDNLGWIVRWRGEPQPQVLTRLVGATNSVFAVGVHRGRGLLATASYDSSTRLYRLADRGDQQPLATIPGTGNAYVAEFSADGTRLFLGGEQRGVRVYDVTAPQQPVPLGTLATSSTVWQLRVSRDGQVAAAGSDGTVTVWGPADGPAPSRA